MISSDKFLKLSIISLLTMPLWSYSQNWPVIYGDNLDVIAWNINEDYDKGFIICASILKNSETYKYGWLIKTDINGTELWNRKFGNSIDENYFVDFDRCQDNGLIFSGASGQFDSELDPIFIKLNACGDIEWCKIYLSNGYNAATGVLSMQNGQYMGMLRYYGGDADHIRISLVKMDSTGNPLWIKNLAQEDSTTVNEEGNKIYSTPDSNIVVCGRTFGGGMKPFWIKTDTAGEELWELKWQGGYGNANCMCFSSNGNYYSSAFFRSPGMENHPTILKFSAGGQPMDQFQLMGDTIESGGAGPINFINDTTITTVLGWTDDPLGFEGYTEVWLIDTLGNKINSRALINEPLNLAQQVLSSDDKILVLSTIILDGNWDIYMWKMNTDLEDDTLYTQPLTYDSLCPYEIQSDTVLLDCGLYVNIEEIPTKEEYESTIKISPNPAVEWVALTLPDVVAGGKVELAVYDVYGRHGGMGHGEGAVEPVNRMILLNVADYRPGMFIAVVQDLKGRRYTGKFVVCK